MHFVLKESLSGKEPFPIFKARIVIIQILAQPLATNPESCKNRIYFTHACCGFIFPAKE